MCGIIGYTGGKKAMPLLMQGLRVLEYRGYDSAGIALGGTGLQVFRQVGKVERLESSLPRTSSSTWGIGHTRWATHGGVTEANCHPHIGPGGKVAVVHNGIIDNYLDLRKELEAGGAVFRSETDTEVISHLIEKEIAAGPEEAVLKAISHLQGTWGIAVVFNEVPGLIIAARNGSPMVIGIGDKETFVASDPSAFASVTRQVIFLQDRDLAILKNDTWELRNLNNETVHREKETLSWSADGVKLGDYEHYFLKEVAEQPDAVERALGKGGRLQVDFGTAKLGGLNMEKRDFFDVHRVTFIGMGTALYAAQIGAKLVETWARIPSNAEDASELRTGNPIVDRHTLYFAVSQSGETADTISAVREIQEKGGRVLGIVNTVGSSLARLCQGGIYVHAGPEISVASSKAFSSQVTVMALAALLIGRMRHLSLSQGQHIVSEFQALPDKIRACLALEPLMADLARRYKGARSMLVLGRGIQYPLALEAALKIKELSYIHAEGYAAGNLKHGPLTLVGPETPTVVLAVEGDCLDRTIGNMAEVKARDGILICITNSDDARIQKLSDHVVRIPRISEDLSPLLSVVPIQYFAYYLALELGRDIDRPRNLAKSVTTE